MLAVYAYFDAQRNLRKAESDEFQFLGTWASTGTYASFTKDTVNYSNSQYVCIVDNVGYNPSLPDTQENPQPWSPLVLLIPATPGTNTLAQQAFDLAESAYSLAVVGTNIGTNAFTLATAGSNLAWEAFVLAQSGTTGSDPQALAIAQAAFAIAVIGTNLGTNAYNLATSAAATAAEALNIAIIGTNTAAQAFSIAIIGTNQAQSAMTVGQSAFSIAVQGTSVGTEALRIAVIGTNLGTLAYNTAIQALAVANQALSIAVAGTNGVATLFNIIGSGSNSTFGTNVAIGNGTSFVYVNGLNLPFTPSSVVGNVQMPGTNSLNLWPTLVGQPTNNGFVVSLNGQTDSTGYRLHYLARQ